MTLEGLFQMIVQYREEISFSMLIAPWLTYVICFLIPGKLEEPFVLSVNLTLATISMLMLTGYLAYATNTGGWEQVVKQADIFLPILPPYYSIVSLWISRQRLPLNQIPAYNERCKD